MDTVQSIDKQKQTLNGLRSMAIDASQSQSVETEELQKCPT